MDSATVKQEAGALCAAGDLAGAKKMLETHCGAVQVDDIEIWGMLSELRQREQDLPGAIQCLRQIIRIAPDQERALYIMALLLAQNGDVAESEAVYLRLLSIQPNHADAHNDLGHLMRVSGRLAEACGHFDQALLVNPQHLQARYNLGLACAQLGQLQKAAEHYRQALEMKPDFAEAANNLGNVLRQLGEMEQAVAAYREAVTANPQFADVYGNLAVTLENLHRLDEAKDAALRCLELVPGHPVAQLVMAQIERRQGQLQEAKARLQQLTSTDLQPVHYCAAFTELGHTLDRLEDYASAFDAFNSANQKWMELLGPGRVYDTGFRDRVIENHEFFTRERIERWGKAVEGEASPQANQPVFLVGFPRSGTTLVEQVLAAHSEVVVSHERVSIGKLVNDCQALFGDSFEYPSGVDDLSDEDVQRFRRYYWDQVEKNVPGFRREALFVDKMPLNLVDLGFVRKVFPNARVVMMLRDPRDVCLSAYFQGFDMNQAMVSFLDLERAAELYEAVMNLWLHYREILGLEYMEVRYEDMLADQIPVTRQLLAFIGKEWEDSLENYRQKAEEGYANTPSYQSVVEPLYTRAAGRWKNYRAQISPIIPRLSNFVEAFGYSSD